MCFLLADFARDLKPDNLPGRSCGRGEDFTHQWRQSRDDLPFMAARQAGPKASLGLPGNPKQWTDAPLLAGGLRYMHGGIQRHWTQGNQVGSLTWPWPVVDVMKSDRGLAQTSRGGQTIQHPPNSHQAAWSVGQEVTKERWGCLNCYRRLTLNVALSIPRWMTHASGQRQK
eukprot:EG_transcript_4827